MGVLFLGTGKNACVRSLVIQIPPAPRPRIFDLFLFDGVVEHVFEFLVEFILIAKDSIPRLHLPNSSLSAAPDVDLPRAHALDAVRDP